MIDASPGGSDAPLACLAFLLAGSLPASNAPVSASTDATIKRAPGVRREPPTHAHPTFARDARHADAGPAEVRAFARSLIATDGGPAPTCGPAPIGAISERGHRLAFILARPVAVIRVYHPAPKRKTCSLRSAPPLPTPPAQGVAAPAMPAASGAGAS
jgi:hypothetical protein